MTTPTSKQAELLAHIISGATITAAAAAVGIHRNTVAYWRACSPNFDLAFTNALSEKVLLLQERAEGLLDLAYDQLHKLLEDPKTPPSVRLKAIQLIIQQATTLPPATIPPIVHNSAQPDAQEPVTTIRREDPKIGRNDPCPCNSGKKYKQCCLNLHNTAQPEANAA